MTSDRRRPHGEVSTRTRDRGDGPVARRRGTRYRIRPGECGLSIDLGPAVILESCAFTVNPASRGSDARHRTERSELRMITVRMAWGRYRRIREVLPHRCRAIRQPGHGDGEAPDRSADGRSVDSLGLRCTEVQHRLLPARRVSQARWSRSPKAHLFGGGAARIGAVWCGDGGHAWVDQDPLPTGRCLPVNQLAAARSAVPSGFRPTMQHRCTTTPHPLSARVGRFASWAHAHGGVGASCHHRSGHAPRGKCSPPLQARRRPRQPRSSDRPSSGRRSGQRAG